LWDRCATANSPRFLRSLEPAKALILCAPADSRELSQLRGKYPRLVHVPLREDWTQTLLLVAGESLRRTEALRLARQAEGKAARNEQHAMLGRYMIDMKHSVNNALTSMIGNAELLLLEPGQLTKQSLAQIKTIHSMALRINEIMQRFSSLTSEMRDAENASQAETEEAPAARRGAANEACKARKLLINKGIYQPDTAPSPPELLAADVTSTLRRTMGEVCRAEKSPDR